MFLHRAKRHERLPGLRSALREAHATYREASGQPAQPARAAGDERHTPERASDRRDDRRDDRDDRRDDRRDDGRDDRRDGRRAEPAQASSLTAATIRPVTEVEPHRTPTRWLEDQPLQERRPQAADPDVVVDVPSVRVDEISLELDELQARVALDARVLDLLRLNVGVDAQLRGVRLDIKGVEAQALLKARLDNLTVILERVMTTIDANPQILERLTDSVGTTLEEVGSGAGHAVEEVGAGAGHAVEEVGGGAGHAVEEVGSGAGHAVDEVGSSAGRAVGDLGTIAQPAAPQPPAAPRPPAPPSNGDGPS